MVHVNNITIIGTRIIVTIKERIFHKAFITKEGMDFWDIFFLKVFHETELITFYGLYTEISKQKKETCVEELRRE